MGAGSVIVARKETTVGTASAATRANVKAT
jgi:hypothetical protein